MADVGQTDLSAVVVTYNSERHIEACLDSLLRAVRGLGAEVWVIDNASADSTCALVCAVAARADLPVRLVRNPRNVGFTRAVNQGLARASGRFLLLLNPDVEVPEGTIHHLIGVLEREPRVGLAAPQLRFPDGRLQPSCRRFPRRRDVLCELLGLARLFPRSRLCNGWKMGDFDHTTPREVDQPQGAFLLARREAAESVGLLDERFVMFFSDVDWCRRFWEQGWRVVFRPEVYAVHHKGASVYRHRVATLMASHRDFVRYFAKYPSRWPLVDIGMGMLLLTTLWPRIACTLIPWPPHGKREL